MKAVLQAVRIGVGALALGAVVAQGAQFYRIAAPVATAITAASADGHITWTNSPTSATFTVQTVQSLGGQANWVNYAQVPVTGAVTTYWVCDPNPPAGMALIPAGSFTMGNCMDPSEGSSDELPLHTVYVSAFYMDIYSVTYGLWTNVYHWATNHGYSFDGPIIMGKAPNHPVDCVVWADAVKWCNARSEMEGLTPCYYTSASLTQMTICRSGEPSLTNGLVNWKANGYRLPTEAEWEKAGRGGVSGHRFPWSDADTIDHSRANYYSCGEHPYDVNPTVGWHPTFNDGVWPYTSPVGYFAPNGYGLYDMAGNMGQWCWDWYGSYSSDSQTDPHGPYFAQLRTIRGGDWYYDPDSCRTAHRGHYGEGTGTTGCGLRCVRASGQ
jgi:formylglycine-generating enzyme